MEFSRKWTSPLASRHAFGVSTKNSSLKKGLAIILLTSLLALTSSFATTLSEIEARLGRATPKTVCQAKYDSFAKWSDEKGPAAPAAVVEDALKALEEIHGPSIEDLAFWRTEMKNNFPLVFPRYLSVAGGACSQLFLGNAKIIIRALETQPALRKDVVPRLSSILNRLHYETLLDGLIGFVVINYGLDHGTWESSPALRKEITKARLEGKAASIKFSKRFDPVLKRVDPGQLPDPAAETARLEKSPDLGEVRKAILEEFDLARRIQSQVDQFRARLKPRAP